MVGYIDFLIASIPIFLSIFIPGFLLALALLKKTKLSLAEIAAFGFMLGLIVPPVMLFVYSLAGIKFSFELAVLNFLAITVIGLILCVKERVFPLQLSFYYMRDIVWVLLLLIMLFSFWVRIQSIEPTFYEFDPYFYDTVTQFILTQGEVPPHDDLAWYPYPDNHRVPPLTNYLEAQWYTTYQAMNGLTGFDNYLFATMAGVYPPVVGAMIPFLFFILFSQEYGRRYGLLSAALISVAPVAIEKFAAGESEQQPWGLFAAFFFYAVYALAITRGDSRWRFAILAGIVALSATLGSKQDVLVYLVLAGYTLLQSTVNFFMKKSNRGIIEANLIVIAFALPASIMLQYYLNAWEVPSDILTVAFATVYAAGLLLVDERVESGRRMDYFLGFIFLLFIITLVSLIPGFPIPVGQKIFGYVNLAQSEALPSSPLMMTVAEESPTGNDFVSSLGFFGVMLGDISMMHIILFISALAIVYAIYRGSPIAMLLAVMIFPISYVGGGIPGLLAGKTKYMLHTTFMVMGAVVVIFGEVERNVKTLWNGYKGYAKYGVFILACAALVVEAFVYPPLSFGGLIKDFILPPLSGGPAGDVAYGTFPLLSSVMKYSIPDPSNPGTAVHNCTALSNDGRQISTYLYCSKIPDYWLDPMNWIKNNVAENDRVIHWWDYGHWTNYFGQRKTVTRNDHQHQDLDLEVANGLVSATPAELKQWMCDHQAKYVLLDEDLIGKWGALNFLSCVYNNQTNMSFAYSEGQKNGQLYALGTSTCEMQHNFERVYFPVPSERVATDYCQSPNPSAPLIRARSTFGYSYCLPENMNGYMVYEDNLTKYNDGFLGLQDQARLSDGRDYYIFTVFYTHDTGPDGIESFADRKGLMYDSNFYNGFFLGSLSGFTQVYPVNATPGVVVPVRIFKINGECPQSTSST